jgi:hypothetical protein
MSYSVNHGVDKEGMDNTQRGLLIGLPAIALALSFGAIKHHPSSGTSGGQNPKLIPVVSSLSTGAPPGSNTTNSGNTPAPSTNSPSVANFSSQTSTGSLSSATPSGGSTGTTTPIGGRGGGPTGGGGTTLPDCSLDQIATVTCQVPACSPEVTLMPGQKAILGVDGTCVVLN